MKKKKTMLILVVGLILLALFLSQPGVISPTFTFAGFTFADSGHLNSNANCNNGGGSTDINRDGETIIMTSNGNIPSTRKITTEVTGVDELLIVYGGYAQAYTNRAGSDSGDGSFGASIDGSESGSIGGSQGISCRYTGSLNSCNQEQYFAPGIWKFKNNFDGTWSSMKSLGIGDVFLVESTQPIKGSRTFLTFYVTSGSGCNTDGGGAAKLRIYNIIRKENSLALCKADQVPYDLNNDGKITFGECSDLKTILLNQEESIEESNKEYLDRITAEQQAKIDGLNGQITTLQKQLEAQAAQSAQTSQTKALQDQISALKDELSETREILTAVQAGDQNVINTIVNQEQFTKPSGFSGILYAIISFIRGLIGI